MKAQLVIELDEGQLEKFLMSNPTFFLAEKRDEGKIKKEESLASKAVPLVFDAAGSRDRMVRIIRAQEDVITRFEHKAQNTWKATTKSKNVYMLYFDEQNSKGFCECEDFRKRGQLIGMPCKHLYGLVSNTGLKLNCAPRILATGMD